MGRSTGGYMKKKYLIFLLLLAVTGAAAVLYANAGKNRDRDLQKEITVRTIENIHSHKDAVKLVQLAEQYEIGTINIGVKQDEDDEVPSGMVFYSSDIAPAAEGYEDYDALADVIDTAHDAGIKVRAWVPQFHDAVAAKAHPDWQMRTINDQQESVVYQSDGEVFLNPLHPEAQKYEKSILLEIAENYDVDGIVMDWLRFDDYAMDLSDRTRAAYEQENGYDPAEIDFDQDSAQRKQWNAWREKGIASYIHAVRTALEKEKPGLELGIYILPPEFQECGQNLQDFCGDIDFVSPMAYYADWDFTPDWVSSEQEGIMHDTELRAGDAQIIPALNVPEEGESSQDAEMLAQMAENYREVTTVDYFIYGKWTQNQLRILEEE